MDSSRKSVLTYIEYSRKISTIILRNMAPVRKKYRLTKLNANALLFFSGEERPPIASEFSKCGSYSKSNVSKAVSDLTQKNLIIVESSREDRRFQNIQLTEEGRKISKELRDSIEPIINKLSANISSEQKKLMISFMSQLKENIDEVMKDINRNT